jgi:hypothetical protein
MARTKRGPKFIGPRPQAPSPKSKVQKVQVPSPKSKKYTNYVGKLDALFRGKSGTPAYRLKEDPDGWCYEAVVGDDTVQGLVSLEVLPEKLNKHLQKKQAKQIVACVLIKLLHDKLPDDRKTCDGEQVTGTELQMLRDLKTEITEHQNSEVE